MNEPSIYGIKWEPPAGMVELLGRGIDGNWYVYPITFMPGLLDFGHDVQFNGGEKMIDKTGKP